jgi:hypothetical protein
MIFVCISLRPSKHRSVIETYRASLTHTFVTRKGRDILRSISTARALQTQRPTCFERRDALYIAEPMQITQDMAPPTWRGPFFLDVIIAPPVAHQNNINKDPCACTNAYYLLASKKNKQQPTHRVHWKTRIDVRFTSLTVNCKNVDTRCRRAAMDNHKKVERDK